VFEPGSIAVIGASADPAKRGYQILRALGEGGYRGRIYPVNPRGGSLLGHQVFPSVASLPRPADLAVLCTPAASAPDLVRACGERGIPAAIVLAVGFKESGPGGAELERRLVEMARTYGVRVIGPNTSGLSNLHSRANLIGARGVRPGSLALLVQSGNMALALMNEATARSWEGISICAGLGNEADLGFAEVLDYLAVHEQTRGIIVYAEGFRDPRAFLDAAARVSRVKPIVTIKAARSARGAGAALSHTGAIAGPYDRLRAGLAQAGVNAVVRTDEVLHVAETLANQPATAPGTGVAILSDGGGQGTLAVDTLTEAGTPLAVLSEKTRADLRGLLGPAAAVANPVDLAGAADADPTMFARALELLAEDAGVGTILIVGLFGGYAIRFDEGLADLETRAAEEMARRMRQCGKGLVVHSMYASHRSPPLEALGTRGVPVVESLDVACRCVSELVTRGARLARPVWRASAAPPEVSAAGASIISRARADGRTLLTEPEARRLLEAFGVEFSPSSVVASAGEAAAALARIGAPAVLKVVSGRIIHKSDVGGVVLSIRSPEEAERAFGAVQSGADAYRVQHGLADEPRAALLTRMAPPPLAELLVGACRDPGLGPVLSVGGGGILVEALNDVAHRVLPIEPDDVVAMLSELRIRPVLAGVRGAPAADLGAIAAVARAVAECILAVPDMAEIEINPLFAYADRAEAIDARVILSGAADG
jgi:acetyltransferase